MSLSNDDGDYLDKFCVIPSIYPSLQYINEEPEKFQFPELFKYIIVNIITQLSSAKIKPIFLIY